MHERRSFLRTAAATVGAAALTGVNLAQAADNAIRDAKGLSIAPQPVERPLQIGAIVFPGMDQIDLTGPFSVLCRLPNASIQLLWKDTNVVRDHKGLGLVPDAAFEDAKPIDVLLVPGGPGQEELMADEVVLSFIVKRAQSALCVFSVCTGALVCGAAGLLKGKTATTHWESVHLLKYFGATPSEKRVIIDGSFVSAAGLTAGIDGALTVATLLRGEEAAKAIQLGIQYAPEPPFDCGLPQTAPAEIIARVKETTKKLSARRLETSKRMAVKLQVPVAE